MNLDADIVILGGGCAGLSLAVALAQRAPHLSVQVVEARQQYRRDRTWCFWNTTEHAFSSAVTHRWHHWRVRTSTEEVRQHSTQYAYEHLPADRFYDIARKYIDAAAQKLALGVKVHGICELSGVVETQTDQGTLRSQWVFDSRPPSMEERRPVLVQRFVGWHVRSHTPCFDPALVDLMDFQSDPADKRIFFFYVLPFSSTEALVEATYIEEPTAPPIDGDAALQAYLHRLCGAGYEVLYREAAALPMGEQQSHKQTRDAVIEIGMRGGRVKASSGYAFQRIQRQSAALAAALARGSALPQAFEAPIYGTLDAIFLRALLRAPHRAASYFLAMFRLPPETLVRFLSESATSAEILRVMWALPKLDFLQAAFSPLRGVEA